MRAEMVNPQKVIMEELADRRITQRSVALTYAFILRQEPRTADWPRINQAIIARWKGGTALARVKIGRLEKIVAEITSRPYHPNPEMCCEVRVTENSVRIGWPKLDPPKPQDYVMLTVALPGVGGKKD